ncbi:MAG: MBL fold metallo-hydrolase [Planctomycetota bacterium]
MQVEKLTVGPLQCNCYVVYDGDTLEAVVIDPGGDAADIIGFCEDEGLSPRFVIITHAHADHMGGLPGLVQKYPGVDVCVGEKEMEIYDDALCNLTQMVGLDMDFPDPDMLLTEDDTISCGSVNLRVLHTPGHTRGAITLVADAEDPPLMFCGDLVFRGSVGRVDLPGGDRDALRASIENKILPMSDDTVLLPGHEQKTTVGEERGTVAHV